MVCYERDRKGCQDATQEVEIYFNFAGKYVPPHFGEVTLSPNEQEALYKKEERRDRLHRNYLRRKSSGKQREYEERIKSEKKQKLKLKKRLCVPRI
jgi:site-specific DNA recombinase